MRPRGRAGLTRPYEGDGTDKHFSENLKRVPSKPSNIETENPKPNFSSLRPKPQEGESHREMPREHESRQVRTRLVDDSAQESPRAPGSFRSSDSESLISRFNNMRNSSFSLGPVLNAPLALPSIFHWNSSVYEHFLQAKKRVVFGLPHVRLHLET